MKEVELLTWEEYDELTEKPDIESILAANKYMSDLYKEQIIVRG